MMRSRWFGAVLFALGLAGTALAQKPNLNVRLGLWEITVTTKVVPQAPPPMSAPDMTPDRKAQMDADMKEMTAPRTEVSKDCWTRADLDSGEFMKSDVSGEPECKRTITRNTATALDLTIECTGDAASTARMTVEAPSPTAVKATMQSTSAQGGQSMTLSLLVMGKWLAANCGEIQ